MCKIEIEDLFDIQDIKNETIDSFAKGIYLFIKDNPEVFKEKK